MHANIFRKKKKGTTSFNQLKQDIANLCEIDVKYIKLHTKVAPTIVVQGNDESLDDILGGNTWLVVRFDLEAFEKFPPRVDFRFDSFHNLFKKLIFLLPN